MKWNFCIVTWSSVLIISSICDSESDSKVPQDRWATSGLYKNPKSDHYARFYGLEHRKRDLPMLLDITSNADTNRDSLEELQQGITKSQRYRTGDSEKLRLTNRATDVARNVEEEPKGSHIVRLLPKHGFPDIVFGDRRTVSRLLEILGNGLLLLPSTLTLEDHSKTIAVHAFEAFRALNNAAESLARHTKDGLGASKLNHPMPHTTEDTRRHLSRHRRFSMRNFVPMSLSTTTPTPVPFAPEPTNTCYQGELSFGEIFDENATFTALALRSLMYITGKVTPVVSKKMSTFLKKVFGSAFQFVKFILMMFLCPIKTLVRLVRSLADGLRCRLRSWMEFSPFISNVVDFFVYSLHLLETVLDGVAL